MQPLTTIAPLVKRTFWSLICTTEHLGRPHLNWFTVSAKLQFTLTTCLPKSCPSFRGVQSCEQSQTNQDVQIKILSGEVIKLSDIMDDVSTTIDIPDHSTTRHQLLTFWTIRPPTIDTLDHSSITDTPDHSTTTTTDTLDKNFCTLSCSRTKGRFWSKSTHSDCFHILILSFVL